MDEPGWHDRFYVAFKLGKTVDEILDMTVDEFEGWRQFFRKMNNG